MEEFEYIRNRYSVPAEMFREVTVADRKGVITEDKGNYIGVVFYDDKKLMPLPCHPTWKVEYLETFNYKPPKPKNPRSKQRYRDYLHSDSSLTFAEWLGIK
ncbi:hypothetical protein [Flavobacterium hungaricum]|uniref:Uncharacterized protein n=1 Tax=Flavobacterium hungaricum TaxID=2082725 RepID=A0ABR9TRG0_9FLAO|nr:hypothetical protein [Flavobacterium hungaricum]MBE8727961.1 hypothetical protein [Flavobacterium hungaricum]